MQEIGDYKIKRPQFILFLDKDGTTNLEDKNLNHIFHLVSTMGGMVIFVTGRTVGDIEGELKQKKVNVPEIIVGDNGAVICYTKTGELVEQKTLEHEKVMQMVNNFLVNGGEKDLIRYTNGKEVFASKEKSVQKYYKGNKIVKFCDDIYETIEKAEDITKVTLAGKEELMKQSAQFVEQLDCWSDRGVTKFPKKESENYRLDIAQRNISKGDAVKSLVQKLQPHCGYICVGNGANDMSMFKTAIDDGMRVAVVEAKRGSKEKEEMDKVFEEIRQYSQEKKKGRVERVPFDRNLANQYILKKAKCFQECMARKEKQRQKPKRLPNLPRIKVEGIDTKNISRGTGWQDRNKER